MNKEVTFTDIKHMVAYVLDTKNQDLIEEYVYQLIQLRKEAKDGIRYEIPKIEFNDETYYWNSLDIKDGKVYIDGEEIKEKKIQYNGTCSISNNKVGTNNGPTIRIIGDLTSYAPIETEKIYCDKLFVHNDIITNRLNCDNVTTHGNLDADDVVITGNINTFK